MDALKETTVTMRARPSEPVEEQQIQDEQPSFDVILGLEPLGPPMSSQELEDMILTHLLTDGDVPEVEDDFLSCIIDDNAKVAVYENALQSPPSPTSSSSALASVQPHQNAVPVQNPPAVPFAIAATAAEVVRQRSGILLNFPPSETRISLFIPATILG